MAAIESLILGSEKLTGIFGSWPSFHDAEVVGVHLHRGEVAPERDMYIFPILTVTMHVWRMTREVDAQGFLVLELHTLVTLRFHGVGESIRIEGFNHQNAIFDLSISQKERQDGPSPFFWVDFQPSFGMGAAFECSAVEVVEAVPCTADGRIVS